MWFWWEEWRYIVRVYRRRASRRRADDTLEWYSIAFGYYNLKLDPVKMRELEITASPVISGQNPDKLNTILNCFLPGTLVNKGNCHRCEESVVFKTNRLPPESGGLIFAEKIQDSVRNDDLHLGSVVL